MKPSTGSAPISNWSGCPGSLDPPGRLSSKSDWLPRLSDLPAAVPKIVHAASPLLYWFRWAALRWLAGFDAWETRNQHGWFGAHLGQLFGFLRSYAIGGAPSP